MEPIEYSADETIYCDDPSLRFSAYLPVIPPKRIIDKTIPGFGATYTEIKAERDSIIVLPNIATILSKHESHKADDNTLPVFEGVSIKEVVEYLNEGSGHKKILTTPESLTKVIKAFKALGIKGYETYFILMDESHKYIQDVNYRPNIAISMDYFFKFENNSMISSTPIKFSDPRFTTFKYLKLQPTYNYDKGLELLYTNNTLQALKSVFERHPHVKQCIFLNSINAILDIIRKFGIGENSIVFCSKESSNYVKKESYNGTDNFKSSYIFEAAEMQQYNFFTSSLYNGLDIILEAPPQVIVVSLAGDSKTYLDPF